MKCKKKGFLMCVLFCFFFDLHEKSCESHYTVLMSVCHAPSRLWQNFNVGFFLGDDEVKILKKLRDGNLHMSFTLSYLFW